MQHGEEPMIQVELTLNHTRILGQVTQCHRASVFMSEKWDNDSSIVLPELPSGMDSILDGNRVKRYLKYTLYPLMELFGKNNMPKVDEHLTNYYQLNDEGRNEVDQFIKAQLMLKKDPARAEDVKKIKKW